MFCKKRNGMKEHYNGL